MTQFKYLGAGNFVCTSNGEKKRIRRGEIFDANDEDVELFKTFTDLELVEKKQEKKLEVKQPKKEEAKEVEENDSS